MTEDEAQKAVDYLRDSATKAAQSRANRIYLEQWVKVIKAQEQAKHDGTVAAIEVKALTSEAYAKALEAYQIAVEEDEKYRFMREAAHAKLEFYRTYSANNRVPI